MLTSASDSADSYLKNYRWWTDKCEAVRRVCEAIEDAEAAMDRAVAEAGGGLSYAGVSHERAVLVAHVDHLLQDRTNVLITGMVGRGKSLVATALLDGEVWTQSRGRPLTAKPTRAVWGETRSAAVRRRGSLERVPVAKAMEMATQLSDNADVTEVVQFIPHELLRLGVEVIDSPGLGDPGEISYDEVVQKEITAAHVIIVVLMCPPKPEKAERLLVENVGANANKTIIVANLSAGLLEDPDEASDKADFLDTINTLVAAGAEKAGISAEEIPVVVINAKRAAKAADREPTDRAGRGDLQRAVANVIDREVWQDRLAQATELVAENRRAGVERGRMLLAKAQESLDVGRELSRLKDQELDIAKSADRWNQHLMVEGANLADRAAEISARPYAELSQILANGRLPSGKEMGELQQRFIREAEADLELLEMSYKSQLARILGAELEFASRPELSEARLKPPSWAVPFSMGTLSVYLAPIHPIFAVGAGVYAIKKLFDAAAPAERKIAAHQARLSQEEEQAAKTAREWAAQVTDSAREAVRAIADEQVAEVARLRQDMTSPINPELAPAFRDTIAKLVTSLENLEIASWRS